MIGRTISNLGRLRQITTVVARHGLGHYLERRRERHADEGPAAPIEDIPASARRFRAILQDLGPTFIKFGQVLSTRPDLLPHGFAEALSDLQDHCAAMPYETARAAIEQGLDRPVDTLFRELDATPVASASIAQVHRAVTLDGHEVAVKVQRPGIREQIIRDLDLLAVLAQLVEAIVQESGLVTPREVVEEFENAILGELDFVREAENLRRFRENLDGRERSYVVPRVYDALSSRTVLTMEFVRGTRIADVRPGPDRCAVAANIVRAAFEQLFEDGLFHADPHPGNAFVLEDNRIALLDFGAVGEISYAMRETLALMVIGVGMRDADAVARLLYRVGVPEGHVSLHRLRDACASLFDTYLRDEKTLANIKAARLLGELFDLASRFQVRLPAEYASIAKASIQVEGVVRSLDPNLEVVAIVKPYLKRLVDERLGFADLGDKTLKSLMRAGGFLRELPITASQILMDLENGKLQIQIDSPKLDNIARSIDALGLLIVMGLVSAGLVTGSFFLLARYDFELWGIPVVPTLGLYLASVLFGAAIGRYLLAPRIRKISVARWLSRRRRRR
ncbi:MAG: AarF/UbiB family protein [Myxococcota bacterium]